MLQNTSALEVSSQSQEHESGSTYDEITETAYSELYDTAESHYNHTAHEAYSTYESQDNRYGNFIYSTLLTFIINKCI